MCRGIRWLELELGREGFLREALASWESFQEAGLHVTGEEVLAWLESWGTEEELAAPECHT